MSDDEQEKSQEQQLNEMPIPDIDIVFRKDMLDCKKSIYTAVVFSLPENSNTAQEPDLLIKYIKLIQILYSLFLPQNISNVNPNNIPWTNDQWNKFPQDTHKPIETVLAWYKNFLKKNQNSADHIPYQHYISQNLITYPYSHRDTSDDN